PLSAAPSEAEIGRALTRRGFLARAGLATAGFAVVSGGIARAFPPDSFYDDFNLARMIYHENPVGASPAALEAIRRALLAGPTATRRYEEDDDAELVAGILAYNRERSPRAVDRLDHRNVICLDGSAEGLMLGPDTF